MRRPGRRRRPTPSDPPGGAPVARRRRVDEAGHEHDDQHDRAVDVAHGDQQVAQHQRRARVGAAATSCAAAPTTPTGSSAQIIRPANQDGRSRYCVIPPSGAATAATKASGAAAPYDRARRRPRASRRRPARASRRWRTPGRSRTRWRAGRRDDQRAEQPPLPLGRQVRRRARRAGRSAASARADLLTEAVLPPQVGRLGVAVEEVAGVADEQEQRGDEHGEDGGERPPAGGRRWRRGRSSGLHPEGLTRRP